jgi:site-specific DNA-cytosine methylase
MTRGFHDSGRFESIFAVEFDLDAAATYRANFPEVEMQAIPIEDVELFPQADVVGLC